MPPIPSCRNGRDPNKFVDASSQVQNHRTIPAPFFRRAVVGVHEKSSDLAVDAQTCRRLSGNPRPNGEQLSSHPRHYPHDDGFELRWIAIGKAPNLRPKRRSRLPAMRPTNCPRPRAMSAPSDEIAIINHLLEEADVATFPMRKFDGRSARRKMEMADRTDDGSVECTNQ